jgi:hypothetical protein
VALDAELQGAPVGLDLDHMQGRVHRPHLFLRRACSRVGTYLIHQEVDRFAGYEPQLPLVTAETQASWGRFNSTVLPFLLSRGAEGDLESLPEDPATQQKADDNGDYRDDQPGGSAA